MAHGFCNIHALAEPQFCGFLKKKDVGLFREIHLWLFESGKRVNCFSVNNTYQENFFFFFQISKKAVLFL